MKTRMPCSLLVLSLLHYATSFDIIQQRQYPEDVKAGGKVTLMCKADSDWEFCDWSHKGSAGTRDCKMEWKYSKGDVQITECHKELKTRIKRVGNYKLHECGLEISRATLKEAGEWECQMEEYVSGPFGGTRHAKTFNLEISRRTTMATTKASTTTTETTTQSTTSLPMQNTDTDVVPEIETTTVENESLLEEDSIVPEPETPSFNSTNEDLMDLDNNDDHEFETNNTVDDQEASAASLREAPAPEEGSGGTIAAVVVVVIVIIIAGLGGGMFWVKKKRETDIITLQKIREEGNGGTNAFLEEAEYSMSAGFTNLTPPPE